MRQLIDELLQNTEVQVVAPKCKSLPNTPSRKRRHCYMENCSNKTTVSCSRCQKYCCGVHVGEKLLVCCKCISS